MAGVTTPDGTTWRYRYDPFGRRIAKQRLTGTAVSPSRPTSPGTARSLAEQATPCRPARPVRGRDLGLPPRQLYRDDQAEHTRGRSGRAGRSTQEQIDQRFYAIITDLVGTPAELVAPTGHWPGASSTPCGAPPVWRPAGPRPRSGSPASTPTRRPACTTTSTATTIRSPAATSPRTRSAWPQRPTRTPTSPIPRSWPTPSGLAPYTREAAMDTNPDIHARVPGLPAKVVSVGRAESVLAPDDLGNHELLNGDLKNWFLRPGVAALAQRRRVHVTAHEPGNGS